MLVEPSGYSLHKHSFFYKLVLCFFRSLADLLGGNFSFSFQGVGTVDTLDRIFYCGHKLFLDYIL